MTIRNQIRDCLCHFADTGEHLDLMFEFSDFVEEIHGDLFGRDHYDSYYHNGKHLVRHINGEIEFIDD